jgi:hypothetical protein
MATVEGGGLKVLMRGSMNLNHNPRLEQIDITEGGLDFDLVRRLEEGLPEDTGDPGISNSAAVKASGLGPGAIGALKAFDGVKTWKK